jgi:hypothetical protein
MQIPKHLLICSLLSAAFFCFIFTSPVFSEFKKVNNCELAKVKASVIGELYANRCFSSAGEEIACPADILLDCAETPDDDQQWLNTLHAFLEANPPAAGGASGVVAPLPGLTSGLFLRTILDPTNENTLQPQNFIFLSVLFPGLTIESGTSSGQYGPAGANYVRLGLGSVEGSLDARDILVTSTPVNDPSPQILGSLYVSSMDMKFRENSFVTMYVLNSQDGVGVNVDVALDRIGIQTLSWGDADGVGGTSAAGYVGLRDTAVTGVTAYGSLGIKADTVGTDQNIGNMPVGTRYNHIAMADLAVGMETLDSTVAVGNRKDFSDRTFILGSLYMKNLQMNMNGYLNLYTLEGRDLTGIDLEVAIPRLTVDTLSWGDSDGTPDAPFMGGVGLRNLSIEQLKIAGQAAIEMRRVQAGDTGINPLPVGTALVNIGLTQVSLSMESLDADVGLGDRKDNLNQILGSIYLGGLKTVIDGGVSIHTPTPSTQGAVFDLDLRFPLFSLETLSWGNMGQPGGTMTAGYVGFKDFTIGGLTVTGPISLNVATQTVPPSSMMSASFVRLSFGTPDAAMTSAPSKGNFFIGMTSLKTDIVLDKVKTLNSSSKGVLGSFYMGNVAMSINGWVDIGAH